MIAGSTHAARIARHSGIAEAAPSGMVPGGHDGAARVTAQAMPGHGSNGSTGASVPNATTAPLATRAAIGNAPVSARSPQKARAWTTSERRWTGCIEAAIPSPAKRPRSSAWTSWACSTRGMRRVVPTVGASTSSAARTAASPMPWIWVAMPSEAARVACSARRAGVASQTPRPSLGAGGSPGGWFIGSRSAAVRDPSDPSAKALSQPRRSRSSGSGPSGSPLRTPATPAASSCSARMLACRRTASSPAPASWR